MELDETEKSHIWWKATIKGALKGLAIGLAVGAATAVALWGLSIAIPAFLPVFTGFITMSGLHGASALTWGLFSMKPLAAFSGISGFLGAAVNSGDNAVAAYHQQKHYDWQKAQDAKILELDGREHAVEQKLAPSAHIKSLVAQGPRAATSFADAETQRAQAAPSAPTIH